MSVQKEPRAQDTLLKAAAGHEWQVSEWMVRVWVQMAVPYITVLRFNSQL